MIIESTSQNLEGWSSSLTKERKTDPTRFEQYVDTLALNMALNDRAMADRRTGSESYRFDPEKWIRYVETKSNEIPGTVLIPREGKIIQIHENTAIPTDPDAKLSKEQVLLAIALTEAKLKVLQPVMENVYPALWKDTMRNLEAKKKEILNPAKHYEPFTIKQAFGVASTLAIVLSACGPTSIVTTRPIEDGTPTSPTASATIEAPTYTVEPPTATATATELPPTEEIEFTHEGFIWKDLVKNPVTGKNEIGPNSEGDWDLVYEELVGGLWLANLEAIAYQPNFHSDASKYATKEAFIAAVKEGKPMEIGFPVRIDTSLIPQDNKDLLLDDESLVVFELVTVKLSSIEMNALTPSQFEKLTGRGYFEEGQKAYNSSSYPDKPGAVTFWSVNKGGYMSHYVGNYDSENMVPLPKNYNVGEFNPLYHEKYSTYFDENGLGVNVAPAVSWMTIYSVRVLSHFDKARVEFIDVNGNRVRAWTTEKTWGYVNQVIEPSLYIKK